MADNPDLGDVFRRAADANARLYRGWLELSLDYLRSVTEILDPQAESKPAASGAATTAPSTTEPAAERDAASGAVILEGVGGSRAAGAFLLTNDLGRPLECEPVATSFAGPDGKAAKPKVTFEPKKVTLQPGEQRVVRVELPVSKSLAAGAAYNAEIGIKGMKGFAVPVVLRRQDDVAESPIERAAAAGEESEAAGRTGAKKKATGAKKKATGAKKPSPKKTTKASSSPRTTKKASKKTASKKAASKAAGKKAASKKAAAKRAPAKKAARRRASKKKS